MNERCSSILRDAQELTFCVSPHFTRPGFIVGRFPSRPGPAQEVSALETSHHLNASLANRLNVLGWFVCSQCLLNTIGSSPSARNRRQYGRYWGRATWIQRLLQQLSPGPLCLGSQ